MFDVYKIQLELEAGDERQAAYSTFAACVPDVLACWSREQTEHAIDLFISTIQ
jgi:hypothetical protein